ncbi:hypothetical protein CLCOS_14890 [Clostridium coskatii]|uniref:Uncharacterized protein n=1 Tax=Clostridium coskatii TaxID=1705578 RepID=A0A166TLF6_9CLOT|nr:hypothetical protein WX73_03747 [Clostridium coskatii]OBR95165.1 hypothetical protein CLCOS_14890 [Clostridium coskatii]
MDKKQFQNEKEILEKDFLKKDENYRSSKFNNIF